MLKYFHKLQKILAENKAKCLISSQGISEESSNILLTCLILNNHAQNVVLKLENSCIAQP